MGNSSSGSNPLSALASQLGGGLNGITGGGQFGGDPSASGLDVSSLFSNLGSFNQDTASIQATQAITPPAQAQANAAQGQDPSAGVGGTQSQGPQTASTGPSGQQNQPSQDQQEQEQRNKAIDELRRLFRQREKQQQQPPQWHPRYAGDQQQTAAAISPQAATGAGLSSSSISPDAAVRAGLLDQSLIDPATGTIRRDQPAPAEEAPAAPVQPPALPDPSGRTSAGQLVPGEEGRQITVRPRAPLPARTVPGTPGAPAGTPDTPLRIPGLPGLGPLLGGLGLGALEGPLLGVGAVPLSATPAETGELPRQTLGRKPSGPEQPLDPEIRAGGPGAGAAAPPAPPPSKDQPKPKPKAAHPPAAEPPRRVWVPPTPGHYVPTTGNVRGPATWVPGTPGHYAEAAPVAHRGPPAAVSRDVSVRTQKPAEAAQRLSEARAEAPAAPPEARAYNQDATMPTLLRDIIGLGFLPGLAAFAGQSRRFPPNTPSNVSGQGGTRPYNENWGGAAYVAKGDEVQRGRQYMAYLANKGLTRQGAAALLGNAHQESNLSATLAPGGDGGTAAGMFQWRGPRQAAFRRWLAANGRSESDPQAHLDFALYEMQTNPAYRASWDALHNPNLTVAQIADIIANNYEGSLRGPTQGMNNRIGFANALLQGGGQAAQPLQPALATGGDARV